VVEREIITALRSWLEGYRVRIEAAGFAQDVAEQKALQAQHSAELARLERQLDNAFDLVEQGVYTLEVFQARREKLNASMAREKAQRDRARAAAERLESAQSFQSRLVPQTEQLLESYEQMTNQERNELLKAVLKRIEYKKGADGRIEIDLYPRLPQL
jgi:chromosome segregation ATPase